MARRARSRPSGEGEKTGDASEAAGAVNAAPRNGDYRLRLGDAYFKLGKIDSAKAQYKRAAQLGNATATRRLAGLQGKK